jgi:hypothetical protein
MIKLFCLLWLLSAVLVMADQEPQYSLGSLINHFNNKAMDISNPQAKRYIREFAAHQKPSIIRPMIDDVRRSGYYGEARCNIYSAVVQSIYSEGGHNREQILSILHLIITDGTKEDASIASDFLADIEESSR